MILYKIKPLEWKKIDHNYPDIAEKYEAHTAISVFVIEKWASGDWACRHCFDEYYDDGGGLCKDLEDGKAICEKIWAERIKKCLIEKEIL